MRGLMATRHSLELNDQGGDPSSESLFGSLLGWFSSGLWYRDQFATHDSGSSTHEFERFPTEGPASCAIVHFKMTYAVDNSLVSDFHLLYKDLLLRRTTTP